MSTHVRVRIPDNLNAGLEAAAKVHGLTVSAIIREAVRRYLDQEQQLDELANLEQRLGGSMTRVMKDLRLVRNDVHLAMAFVNALAETYLLHTPPLPPQAIDSAGASAVDRHAKYLRRVTALLQGGEGLWSAVADSGDAETGDSADE